MAGSVDEVDLVNLAHVVPEGRGSSGGDSDTPLLLLNHPVHGSGSVVDLTDLVRFPRVEQDTLGRSGLSGIDVRHDADVPCKM